MQAKLATAAKLMLLVPLLNGLALAQVTSGGRISVELPSKVAEFQSGLRPALEGGNVNRSGLARFVVRWSGFLQDQTIQMVQPGVSKAELGQYVRNALMAANA